MGTNTQTIWQTVIFHCLSPCILMRLMDYCLSSVIDGVIPAPVKPVVLYQHQAYHLGNGYCSTSFPQLGFCWKWKLFQWKTVKLYGNDQPVRCSGREHKISLVTDCQLPISWTYITIGKKQASVWGCICLKHLSSFYRAQWPVFHHMCATLTLECKLSPPAGVAFVFRRV